jgi:hypothetical protein
MFLTRETLISAQDVHSKMDIGFVVDPRPDMRARMILGRRM